MICLKNCDGLLKNIFLIFELTHLEISIQKPHLVNSRKVYSMLHD